MNLAFMPHSVSVIEVDTDMHAVDVDIVDEQPQCQQKIEYLLANCDGGTLLLPPEALLGLDHQIVDLGICIRHCLKIIATLCERKSKRKSRVVNRNS